MRKMLLTGCLGLWCLTAVAGILPEFDAKTLSKKQPPESLEQVLALQKEAIVPIAPVEVPLASVPSKMGAREAAIAAQYSHLSAASGGKFYSAIDKALPLVLDELLQAELVDGADIVFLVDHTSSMEDDIDEIRKELHQMVTRFAAKPGVRVGLVTFSDVKSGSKFGYCAHGLSDKYEGLDAFLKGIELLGSIEDVYGAICKTVDEFSWKSKTKRLIVIISDEQPAVGADTNFAEEDVLAKCAKHGIKTNLYPVLVDKYLPPSSN